jgi:Transposase IS66 family
LLADAPAMLRSRIEREPENVNLWSDLGMAEALLGQKAEALRRTLTAVELMLDPPHSHYDPHHRIDLAFVNSPILVKSPQGKAISYTLGQWTAWQRYLKEGVYEIDNNLVENATRSTCLGKKNWLFIGHPDAGWRSAVIYGVLMTAGRYGLDPVA